jgi:phosphodiester glycosidase
LVVLAMAAAATAVLHTPALPAEASTPRGVRGAGTPQMVGPGTTLERIRRRGRTGWIKAYVLRVDLTNPAVRAEVLFPKALAAVEPLSSMARRTRAIAAINGDFFNIRASNAPVGPVVTGGQLIKGPQRRRARVAGVGVDGIGRISTVRLRGVVHLPAAKHALRDLNDANPGFPPLLAPNGIGLFTPVWGSYSRGGAVSGQPDVTEVSVRRERVTTVRRGAGRGPIPRDGYALLGAGAGGRALARLQPGDPVSVRYRQEAAAAADFQFAIGGKYVLVRDGVTQPGVPAGTPAPRTAIGFSAGGRRMYLVATEGRRRPVPGLTIPELARFIRGVGARDALLLDDGGSTTIVARLPGHPDVTVLNRPSDGRERPVANGIGVFRAEPPARRRARCAGSCRFRRAAAALRRRTASSP